MHHTASCGAGHSQSARRFPRFVTKSGLIRTFRQQNPASTELLVINALKLNNSIPPCQTCTLDGQLETDTIRGVGLAGVGLKPIIFVNRSSNYNQNEKGRRFTMAHELCHILHDQSRARKLPHISGPWASPAIEQRANAFAAWLLMPRRLLSRLFLANGDLLDIEGLQNLADDLHVTDIALLMHLYNLRFIRDFQRDNLMAALTDRVRPDHIHR